MTFAFSPFIRIISGGAGPDDDHDDPDDHVNDYVDGDGRHDGHLKEG